MEILMYILHHKRTVILTAEDETITKYTNLLLVHGTINVTQYTKLACYTGYLYMNQLIGNKVVNMVFARLVCFFMIIFNIGVNYLIVHESTLQVFKIIFK